ncbi:MAG TPA: YhjD/YihY/BrkB family envelope integrity protein [Gammaproteobacteria bacterium]|jgi:membrane protein
MFSKLIEKLNDFLWRDRPESIPAWEKAAIYTGRLIYRLIRDVTDGDITLRAMSLVFTTFLAIVPMLAVSFSVLKGFGVHNQLEPVLSGFLQPLGERGEEITRKIIHFVDNIRVGILGSVGLAFLFYTAVSLVQKVEGSFNSIWHLQQGRPALRRVTDYLSLLIIGPVLIFTALALSASLQSNEFVQAIVAIEPFGFFYRTMLRLLPYFLVISAFTFFYMFIPNTRVQFKAALIGGIISGMAWQTVGWGFASFVADSTRYTAIYSGFAILILFMIWVYVNWLLLLLGADLVFYIQHPRNLAIQKYRMRLSIAAKERLALGILCLVCRAFYEGNKGATLEELAKTLKLPGQLLDEGIRLLLEGGLIEEKDGGFPVYLPAKPYDELTVKQALDIIRGVPGYFDLEYLGGFKQMSALLKRADQQLDAALSEATLKQLALADN